MSRRKALVFTAMILCGVAGLVQAAEKPIWLVVTRPMFLSKKALQPLIEHRKKDGFETVISTKPIEEAIKNCPRPPRYLLLVGDDEPKKQTQPWYLPAKRIPKTPWFHRAKDCYASDAAYGDRNNDRFPDIPVGRLPARTEKQIETMVRKILTYEAQPPRLEDLEMLLWVGPTLFGEAFDRFAAQTLTQMVKTDLPGWMEPFAISDNPGGASYCCAVDHPIYVGRRLERNPGLILLDGHGGTNSFTFGTWMFHPPHKSTLIFTAYSFVGNKSDIEPLSPMIIFACLCGHFTGDKPSLAEELTLHPAGPVACIAASAKSHALTNLYTNLAIPKTIRQPNRLGDFWLNSLRVGYRIRNPMLETLLKYTQGPFCHGRDMEAIRLEHTTLYQLFGDPATKLRMPYTLECKIKSNGDGTWRWSVTRPKDAETLFVTFRPEEKSPVLPPPKDWNNVKVVRKVFEEANRQLSFKRLAELPADKSWSGTIDKPGVLRLVAIGPKRIYAAAKKLTSPAKPN